MAGCEDHHRVRNRAGRVEEVAMSAVLNLQRLDAEVGFAGIEALSISSCDSASCNTKQK